MLEQHGASKRMESPFIYFYGKSCRFPQTLFYSGIVSIQDLEGGTNLAAT